MQTPSELRQTITNSILDAINSGGLPPWRKPWTDDSAGFGLATSLSTGISYKGINQILLQLASAKNSWQSRWFGTFRQIQAAGGCVKKGEKATRIVLWKPVERKRTNEHGNEVDDSFLIMKEFCVFNIEQATGLDRFRVGFAKQQNDTGLRYAQADDVIESIGADIRYGGNAAFYSPAHDFIQLPHRHQFESPGAFYETAFHEHVHFSEHPTRLNWNRAGEGYAMGELVAELGCVMLMGELHVPVTSNLTNHAAYLRSWISGMTDDSRFIFRAAAQASKAVDFLLSFSRKSAPTESVEDAALV